MGRPRSWSDDDLRRAVEGAISLSQVARTLGLVECSTTRRRVRQRMEALGLGLHVPDPSSEAPVRRYQQRVQESLRRRVDDDEFRRAVKDAASMVDVAQRVRTSPDAQALEAVRVRIDVLGLSTAHFDDAPKPAAPHRVERSESATATRPPRLPARRARRARRWTDEDLRRAVGAATSLAGVHRELGLKIGGSTYVVLQEHIAQLELDTSHFTGQGWRRGETQPPPGVTIPLDEILVEHSSYRNTHALRRRLIRAGILPAGCQWCGRTEWNGRAIPLQLDHINGERSDNQLENLRILCPNCHVQTDTWCSKKRRKTTQ